MPPKDLTIRQVEAIIARGKHRVAQYILGAETKLLDEKNIGRMCLEETFSSVPGRETGSKISISPRSSVLSRIITWSKATLPCSVYRAAIRSPTVPIPSASALLRRIFRWRQSSTMSLPSTPTSMVTRTPARYAWIGPAHLFPAMLIFFAPPPRLAPRSLLDSETPAPNISTSTLRAGLKSLGLDNGRTFDLGLLKATRTALRLRLPASQRGFRHTYGTLAETAGAPTPPKATQPETRRAYCRVGKVLIHGAAATERECAGLALREATLFVACLAACFGDFDVYRPSRFPVRLRAPSRQTGRQGTG